MDKERKYGAMLHKINLLMAYYLRGNDQKLIPPAQMRMLEFIGENEGCTQTDVAARMQVSAASVAQSIKRMEVAGFIKRDTRRENLRAKSLEITGAGVKAAAECRLVFDRLETQMLNGFSTEEREALSSFLLRLIDNLESPATVGKNPRELSEFIPSDMPKC